MHRAGKMVEHLRKVTAEKVKACGYNLDIKNPHTSEDDHDDPVELLARLNASITDSLREQLKAILAETLLQ